MFIFLFSAIAIFLQFIYSFFSLRQIRPEEVSESVRSVYWFSQRLVYEGLSTHLGWYAPLLVIYKIFGFQIDTAKWWRFGLYAVAVVCLATLLKKHGGKLWWLVFLVIVTSPTLLYFNQLATHYGVDLSFLLICLWCLSNFQGPPMQYKGGPFNAIKAILYSFALWFIAMWAWLSYPTFVYYLPALGWWYGYLLFKKISSRKLRIGLFAISLLAFLLPLILGIGYIKNRQILWYDSQDRVGIFRGSGKWDLQPDNMVLRVGETMKAFAWPAPSYYYEVSWSEFGWATPLVVILVGAGFWAGWHRRGQQKYLLGLGLIIATNLLVLTFFVDTGGTWASVRRATGLLAGIYALLVMGFYGLETAGKRAKIIGIFCCAIILFYHAIAYYFNWSNLQKISQHQEVAWFSKNSNSQAALEQYLAELNIRDLYLRCPFQEGVGSDCSYSRIYAALWGSCVWNRLTCHRIWGYDPASGGFIPMKLSLWDSRWTWDKADAKIN